MNSPYDLYKAPRADLAIGAAGSRFSLASRGIRFAATVIDGVIVGPLDYLQEVFLLKMPGLAELGTDIPPPPKGLVLLSSVNSLAIYLAVNFVFLRKGQTAGKKLLNLQMQKRDNDSPLPVGDFLLKRCLPLYTICVAGEVFEWWALVLLVLLVDALCIFRPGHNALHDDLASSKVVKLAL